MPTIPARCRHLHTDGRQCGSPALRHQPLCFQHRAAREPLPTKRLDGRTVPQLPAPDDFPAIQRAIGEVLRLLAEEEITDRRASTLLRGLAIASQNLARTLREQRRQQAEAPSDPVTDLVNHPDHGPLALEAIPSDRPIAIQQNQDLGPSCEAFSEPAYSAHEPAPTPMHRFTPSSGPTPADEERLGALFLRLDENFRDKRRAFIHEKTAELEAQFQSRLAAALEAALAQPVPGLSQFREPCLELQLAAA